MEKQGIQGEKGKPKNLDWNSVQEHRSPNEIPTFHSTTRNKADRGGAGLKYRCLVIYSSFSPVGDSQ